MVQLFIQNKKITKAENRRKHISEWYIWGKWHPLANIACIHDITAPQKLGLPQTFPRIESVPLLSDYKDPRGITVIRGENLVKPLLGYILKENKNVYRKLKEGWPLETPPKELCCSKNHNCLEYGNNNTDF